MTTKIFDAAFQHYLKRWCESVTNQLERFDMSDKILTPQEAFLQHLHSCGLSVSEDRARSDQLGSSLDWMHALRRTGSL